MPKGITKQMIATLQAIDERIEFLDEMDRDRLKKRVLNRHFIEQHGFALLQEIKARRDVGCRIRFNYLFGKSPTPVEQASHSRRIRILQRIGLIELSGGTKLSCWLTQQGSNELESRIGKHAVLGKPKA